LTNVNRSRPLVRLAQLFAVEDECAIIFVVRMEVEFDLELAVDDIAELVAVEVVSTVVRREHGVAVVDLEWQLVVVVVVV